MRRRRERDLSGDAAGLCRTRDRDVSGWRGQETGVEAFNVDDKSIGLFPTPDARRP